MNHPDASPAATGQGRAKLSVLAKQESIPKIQDMLDRTVRPLLLQRLAQYPAVALLGPRQCGKTTLAQSLDGEYFDLEQESDRLRLDLSWDTLMGGRRLLILDEAQSWPEIFPRLRGAIDKHRKKNGRFLLLGSVSPALMVNVSESLAGRLSRVELAPLMLSEVTPKQRGRRWICGGYPDGGVLHAHSFPQWQHDYLATLTGRDLPNWGLPAAPSLTMRLLRMLAASHGQVWNASRIAQSLGLNYKTVNSYMDYLTGAFLVRMLEPFQVNIRKRLVKSPKFYWRDTGLLHALLNIASADCDNLLVQPWVGASWEGFVIGEIIAELSARGRPFTPFWFRSSDGYELDLLLEIDGERWAFEVKLTSSPKLEAMDRLETTANMVGAHRRFLISQGTEILGDVRSAVCNLEWFTSEVIK